MNKIFIFTLGAAVGSLLTWKIVEDKYKKIADEEIESVKERYKAREKMMHDLTEEKVNEVEECETLINDLGYYDNEEEVEDEENCTVKVELGEEYIQPLIISPDDFGDMPGYDTESWTYYSDGILTNEDDEVVTDPESIIGDALEHFGEYDTSVYVRNDNDKCDYEIIKFYEPFNGDES